MRSLADFPRIVSVDTEYIPEAGSVRVVCCGAMELRSGMTWRLWLDGPERPKIPPYPHDSETLFVSFNAPAELSCYLELGWPMPKHILDLCIEFRLMVNGKLDKHVKRDLLNALIWYKLPAISKETKESWRKLVLTGGPWDAEQKAGIINYCMSDVTAAADLLKAMESRLPSDLRRALLRGRYTVAVADMEARGIPVDQNTWDGILEDREPIQLAVAQWANRHCDYPLYDGASFRHAAFEQWLRGLGLLGRWKRRRRSGRLATDEETFKKFSWHSGIERVRQVRQVIQHLRKPLFKVVNGKNYYSIHPFGAGTTSRNAPTGCIFQAPAWQHGLVMAEPGMCLVYADFEQEEFLIGGVLAGDEAVLRVYESGDPYIAYGIRAGLIPADGTKQSHPNERALAKTLMLATQFGMSAYGLAVRLNVSQVRAEELLAGHRRVFKKFWSWSDEMVRMGRWRKKLETVYGWRLAVSKETGENTLRNFLVQGSGAEAMRLSNLFLLEAGIEVCCPVHDAFLVQSRHADLEDVVRTTQRCMEKASEYVLRGHRLRTEVRILRNSDRLLDARGQVMWTLIQTIKSRLRTAA